MRKGRIGVARRVHWLKEFEPKVSYGVSLCKDWAGLVQLVEGEPVTCLKCRRLRINIEVEKRGSDANTK